MNRDICDIEKQVTGRSFFEVPAAMKPAAILIPLIEKDGETHLLFEVRSSGITQGGDVCFPGGSIEDGETPFEAASRETREELLVKQNQIRILAPMNVLPGPRGKEIYSVLAKLNDYDGRYSKDEVDHVFSVSLNWFFRHPPLTYDCRIKGNPDEQFPYERIPGGRSYQWQNSYIRRYYFYEVNGEKIWGLTAEAIFCLMETLSAS